LRALNFGPFPNLNGINGNDDDSRLASGTNNQGNSQYVYDHLGQRILKIDTQASAVTRVFVYDIFGNMLGEVDTNVNPINT